MNLHQHLIVKLTLDIKDGLELEVGDVVSFNKNPNNVKPYGRSLNASYELFQQTVLPFFMITNISKGATNVAIEAYQLHTINMEQIKPTLLGDINEDNQVDQSDFVILSNYISNPNNFDLTEQQFVNADINGDEVLNELDLLAMTDLDYFVQPNQPPTSSILIDGANVGYNLETSVGEDGSEIYILDINNSSNYANGGFYDGVLFTNLKAQGNDSDGEVEQYLWSVQIGETVPMFLNSIEPGTLSASKITLKHTDNPEEVGEITLNDFADSFSIKVDLKGSNAVQEGVRVYLNTVDNDGAMSEQESQITFFPGEYSEVPAPPVFSICEPKQTLLNALNTDVNFELVNNIWQASVLDGDMNTAYINFPGTNPLYSTMKINFNITQHYRDILNSPPVPYWVIFTFSDIFGNKISEYSEWVYTNIDDNYTLSIAMNSLLNAIDENASGFPVNTSPYRVVLDIYVGTIGSLDQGSSFLGAQVQFNIPEIYEEF